MIFILMEWVQYVDKHYLSNRIDGGQFLKHIFIFLRLSFLYGSQEKVIIPVQSWD